MFRRLASGLPKDPVFPHNLKELGYFINEKDEIRSIANPKAYFKFFLTKNERHNMVQREAMNGAIRNIVTERLEELGLKQIRVPLGAKATEPHLPIFISSNLSTASRVIILFYEHCQDLGIFAHRIIGGKGGINEGSAVNFVKHILASSSSPDDESAPGIILANTGQLRWWRRGKKAVTQMSWFALPQASAVDPPFAFCEQKNTIPGNRTTGEHVDYIFNEMVENLVSAEAKLDVIGVSDGAVSVSAFLESENNFKKWGGRVVAFAAVATYYHAYEIKNEEFRNWFVDHGRAYITSDAPEGSLLANHEGHKRLPPHGCPVFSLAEPWCPELMLPKGYKTVLAWFDEVAAAKGEYKNPAFEKVEWDGVDGEDLGWGGEVAEGEGDVKVKIEEADEELDEKFEQWKKLGLVQYAKGVKPEADADADQSDDEVVIKA